jgi:hypothetical protein
MQKEENKMKANGRRKKQFLYQDIALVFVAADG